MTSKNQSGSLRWLRLINATYRNRQYASVSSEPMNNWWHRRLSQAGTTSGWLMVYTVTTSKTRLKQASASMAEKNRDERMRSRRLRAKSNKTTTNMQTAAIWNRVFCQKSAPMEGLLAGAAARREKCKRAPIG